MTSSRFQAPRLDELYARPYDANAFTWRRICARDKVNNIVELVGADRAHLDRVLEVGCGTGAVINQLSGALGREHVGVEMGDDAKAREAPAAASVRFETYDGVTLPYPDATFDLVYASHVVEHVLDPRGFLHELRRVSRRLVYVEVPCELHARTSRKVLQETLNIGHINAYTPDSFELLLETSGLRVLRSRVFDHSYAVQRFFSAPPLALAKVVARRSLLRLNAGVATRVFTYHAGAICERGEMI